mgnify:CR=1 FL=1
MWSLDTLKTPVKGGSTLVAAAVALEDKREQLGEREVARTHHVGAGGGQPPRGGGGGGTPGGQAIARRGRQPFAWVGRGVVGGG